MKKKNIYLFIFIAVIALLFFYAEPSFAQCSMCRKVATDGTSAKAVGNGLNRGILYLLAFPYLCMGFIFRKQILNFINQIRNK